MIYVVIRGHDARHSTDSVRRFMRDMDLGHVGTATSQLQCGRLVWIMRGMVLGPLTLLGQQWRCNGVNARD
jgi:hypothetical protein